MTDTKHILHIVTLGVIAFSAAISCDLDLTPEGTKSYFAGDQVIHNDNDIISYEAGIMVSMRDVNYGIFDCASDVEMDYFNALADFDDNGGDIHRSDESFTPDSPEVASYWDGFYAAIKDYNVFLNGSTEIPAGIDTLSLQYARGEAFFARAYAYLCLARHFGPAYNSSTADTDLCVPIVTVYNQNARPERSTVQKVYRRIGRDLDSAAVLLADRSGSARAYRPTIDAVNALYARYYLDMGDWTNAADYAVNVIKTGNYTLNSTATAFKNEWVSDSGSEPILQFYGTTSVGGLGAHSWYYGVSSMAGRYYTSEYYIPTKELVESYSDDDLRKATWFGTSHPSHTSWTIMSYHFGTFYNQDPDNPDYYVFSKYKGNPNASSSSYPNSEQQIKMLTVSEMYLIAAEASFNAGEFNDAKTWLNELQTSRGADNTSATLDNIKKEWYKETVGQGLRMSCLKRWGEGFSGRTPQEGAADLVMTGTNYDLKELGADSYLFNWPIPAADIRANGNLVQNAGYSD